MLSLRRHRRCALAGTAVLAALVLSGCTGGDGEEPPTEQTKTPQEDRPAPSQMAEAWSQLDGTVFNTANPVSVETFFESNPTLRPSPYQGELVLNQMATQSKRFELPEALSSGTLSFVVTCGSSSPYAVEALGADDEQVHDEYGSDCGAGGLQVSQYPLQNGDPVTALNVNVEGQPTYWVTAYHNDGSAGTASPASP